MHFAATIHDAGRRLEEAAAIFRFKSRSTVEDYDELGARWFDSRAQQFSVRHLQPQRESMEQGARLCRMQAELLASAQSGADTAERELSGFYAAQQEFESTADSAVHAARTAHDLAARATTDSSRVSSEVQSINSGISAASQDPGW